MVIIYISLSIYQLQSFFLFKKIMFPVIDYLLLLSGQIGEIAMSFMHLLIRKRGIPPKTR